jgi:hypothetical protein
MKPQARVHMPRSATPRQKFELYSNGRGTSDCGRQPMPGGAYEEGVPNSNRQRASYSSA